jgi:hypothetical protein
MKMEEVLPSEMSQATRTHNNIAHQTTETILQIIHHQGW